MSAFSKNDKVVIGQIKADEKSNEITAIPNLLKMLYLKGCIVTIDAAGCQKKIVREIRKREADYMISLKGNQSTMHDEIKLFFDDAIKCGSRSVKKARSVSYGHGRIETRICWQSDYIDWFEDKGKWDGRRASREVIKHYSNTASQYSVKKCTVLIQPNAVLL